MICIHTCGLPQWLSGKVQCRRHKKCGFNFFFKYLFIYLRLCWVFTATCRLSPVSGSVGHSVVEEHRLLTAVASPCGGEQALGCSGFGRWGTRAQLPHSIWDPPGPGIEPVSPALQGKLSTTGPPGKPPGSVLELERSPGERNGNLLQCSWLGYPIDRGAWWAAVHAVAYVCVCAFSHWVVSDSCFLTLKLPSQMLL